jgi:ribosomal protein S1
VEKPADALKIGQEITAKVVEFNKEDKKISLSVKALEAPVEAEAPTETLAEAAAEEEAEAAEE